MPVVDRRAFLVRVTSIALGIPAATLLACQRQDLKAQIYLGDKGWRVSIASGGVSLERLLEKYKEYFQVGYLDGPWDDRQVARRQKLLVFIKDKNGFALAGEDLEVVLVDGKEGYVPNVGVDRLLIKPEDTVVIDHGTRLAARFSFFQGHN